MTVTIGARFTLAATIVGTNEDMTNIRRFIFRGHDLILFFVYIP